MLQLRVGLPAKNEKRKKVVKLVMDDHEQRHKALSSLKVTKQTKKKWEKEGYTESKYMHKLRNKPEINFSLPFDD